MLEGKKPSPSFERPKFDSPFWLAEFKVEERQSSESGGLTLLRGTELWLWVCDSYRDHLVDPEVPYLLGFLEVPYFHGDLVNLAQQQALEEEGAAQENLEGPESLWLEERWDSLIKKKYPIFSLMCFHPWIRWCYLAACVREGLWSATRHLGYSSCIYNIGEMSVSMGIAIGEHKDKQKEMNDATAPSFMTGNW